MSLDTPLRLAALLTVAALLVLTGWILGARSDRTCVTAPSVYGDIVWCKKGEPAGGIAQ